MSLVGATRLVAPTDFDMIVDRKFGRSIKKGGADRYVLGDSLSRPLPLRLVVSGDMVGRVDTDRLSPLQIVALAKVALLCWYYLRRTRAFAQRTAETVRPNRDIGMSLLKWKSCYEYIRHSHRFRGDCASDI